MALGKVWVIACFLWLSSFTLAEACRLALVLALDVSSSVDGPEHQLQRAGLAHALTAPEVVDAFLVGGPVAFYAFEWSDQTSHHALVAHWQMVSSEEDLVRIAGQVLKAQDRETSQPHVLTATGAALSHAAQMLAQSPHCQSRTVNISSDGTNNDGVEPQDVYADFPFDSVTVNALIVGSPGADDGTRGDWLQYRRYNQLVSWFEREVLHGPRAFWISAEGFDDFEQAMRIKLTRELELPPVSGLPLLASAG